MVCFGEGRWVGIFGSFLSDGGTSKICLENIYDV